MKRRANKKKKWKLIREKPLIRLWKWYRRRSICEYLCDECSKPYVEKPKGIVVTQLVSGSSTAQIFVEQSYGRKNYYVEFARTKAGRDKILLSPLFTPDHLADVAKVAVMAWKFIEAERGRRQTPRSRQRR